MKSAKYILITLMAAAVLFACKKDKEETSSITHYSFTGTLSFDYPLYIHGGHELTFVPHGVATADGSEIGFYWQVLNVTKVDTVKFKEDPDPENDGRWTVTIPDSIATYSVICTAYATEHYASNFTARITVVDDEKSITGRGFEEGDPVFTDPRDGREYRYVNVGGLDWMRQNLSFAGCGEPYVGCDVMDGVVGRFYCYEDAVDACPEGWRLPTDGEWVALAQSLVPDGTFAEGKDLPDMAGHFLSNASFNGTELLEYWPQVVIDNSSSLSVIPSGYGLGSETSGPSFYGFGAYAAFWTSDSSDEGVLYRYINENNNTVYSGRADGKGVLLSVRCVR